jgi:hypothetical protein
MFRILGSPHTIDELRGYTLAKNVSRSDVPIIVIDDMPFSPLEVLRRHDFNIKQLTDIQDINTVTPYEIICCDIRGVGRHFQSPDEGGHLIQEFRKRFPFKIIIGYSAKQHDAAFNKYFSLCDYIPKKDLAPDDWVEYLDIAIVECTSPIRQWKKIHHVLVDMEVSARHLLRLEDNFVRSILNPRIHFPEQKASSSLPADARAVLQSFAGSLLFHFVVT